MTDETNNIAICPICGNDDFTWDKPIQGNDLSTQDHISGLFGMGADRRDVVLRICDECGNIQAFDESLLPDEDNEDVELSDSLHGWLEYELDLSHGEIMRLVDKHTMLAQGWLASRSSQSTQFKGDGITAIASGQDSSDLNMALGAEFSPFVEDAVIDAEIDKVIAFFKDKKVPWSWWLSPFVQPEDFEDRLKKRGLTTKAHKQTAMILPLPADLPKLNSKVHIEQTNSQSKAQSDWLADNYAKIFIAKDKKEADAPAIISALISSADHPEVPIMVASSKWQGGNIDKAIQTRLIEESDHDDNLAVALIVPSEGLYPYQKMGFVSLFEYQVYHIT